MHGRNLTILGLSLFALVGIMAVSASAAQAKWLLLLDKVSVLEQTFTFTVNAFEFLVPKFGFKIACTGGKGTDNTKLNESHTTQTGGASVAFTGCKDVKFSSVCKIMGVGDPDGTIKASGSGEASMEGEKVLISTEASSFANVQYLGEECPFTEIDGKISGGVTVEILEPLVEKALHVVHVVKQNLFCGGAPVKWHAGSPGEGMVSGSLMTFNGALAATHLVGL